MCSRDILVAAWLVLAIACYTSRAAVLPTTGVYAEQFKLWKSTHRKSYESSEEETQRYSIWLDNMDYIEKHNVNSDEHGYTLKMNHLGDLTVEEWTTFYKCHRPEEVDSPFSPPVSSQRHTSSNASSSSSLPSAFDWREKHKVTKIKSQYEYRCHSCYAFAAAAALESANAIKTGKLYSLSAQQLVDCSQMDTEKHVLRWEWHYMALSFMNSTKTGWRFEACHWGWGKQGMYYNGGCSGGNFRRAWMYVMDYGIASATTYPYRSVEGTCRYSGGADEAVSMTYYRLLTGEDEILRTVAEQGPVVVAIDHRTRTFMFYRSGVYSNHLCSTYYDGLTHEMVVVGYGPTDSSRTKYWILKNSYGTGWGINGYMHMARNKNTCGIAMDAGYPII